jgi:hypothetical protein
MALFEFDMEGVSLDGKEISKFVLEGLDIPVASTKYEIPLAVHLDYVDTGIYREDIVGLSKVGGQAAFSLFAARRHYFDVCRGKVPISTVFADEFISQLVTVVFQPKLLVKNGTSPETTKKLIAAFEQFDPAIHGDIEVYASQQLTDLGLASDAAMVIASVALRRSGEAASDMRMIENLKSLYAGTSGLIVYPNVHSDGQQFNPMQNGYALRNERVEVLFTLPEPLQNDPRKAEIKKGDAVAADKATQTMAAEAEKRAQSMECAGAFHSQRHKLASITVWIETKIVWEKREIRGRCFRIEFTVPVLKTRNVDLVLYLIYANGQQVFNDALVQGLECALKAGLDIRVIGIVFLNLYAALIAFGVVWEGCMNYHGYSLDCIVPDLGIVTEVEDNWH